MATLTFDTHKFIKTLEASGIPEKQAEALASAQQESLQAAFDYREIATKGDLLAVQAEMKATIAEAKAETIKWVVGLIFMQTGVIIALMLKLLK